MKCNNVLHTFILLSGTVPVSISSWCTVELLICDPSWVSMTIVSVEWFERAFAPFSDANVGYSDWSTLSSLEISLGEYMRIILYAKDHTKMDASWKGEIWWKS